MSEQENIAEVRFAHLVSTFYKAWFHFHPEAAVDAGVEGYASLLTPYGEDEIGALIALLEKLLAGLDEIGAEQLGEDARLDWSVLRGAARIEHHELIERDWRLREPARYLPVHAIYQLTVRPVQDLPAALSARLAAIPAHLRGARSWLGQTAGAIPRLWLEAAIEEARRGADFLHALPHHPRIGPLHLERACEAAAHALADFARFLDSDLAPHAEGVLACGREHFERLLHQRHFLDVDADGLYALGEHLFTQTLSELKSVTRALRGDADIGALHHALGERFAPPPDLLEAYRLAMDEARIFVAAQGLISLPGAETLQVVETPVFLRHQIPFAAYVEPTPGDPAQRGLYYVTPPADDAARAEHNALGIRHTGVHEAWPGHHLQFVTANSRTVACSLPRRLNPSATLYEGWALYCEQLMLEQGFLDAPESRFVLLRDRLWRALRILIDVDLHVRGVPPEAAAERLQRELGFTPAQARGEITWYSQAPTVPMGYATGWALITAARARRDRLAPAASRCDFHDRLLSVGSIALPLVLGRAFGEPFRREILREVFPTSGASDRPSAVR